MPVLVAARAPGPVPANVIVFTKPVSSFTCVIIVVAVEVIQAVVPQSEMNSGVGLTEYV
jgi:hypothetical protein